jgi:transcriptional regulator with XRE-family HTH domain
MTNTELALPDPDTEAIARRLRMYMGDHKISRARLALASRIGRTTLGAKLDGNGTFTVDEIVSLARALDQPWAWVLSGEGKRADPHPLSDARPPQDRRSGRARKSVDGLIYRQKAA